MASDWLRGDRDRIVILDSNAIMMLFEFSINLEDEITALLGKYKIIIPKSVYNELKFLSESGKGKKRFKAKPSLQLIKKYEIYDNEGKGDNAIVELAKKLNCIVVTNDKELRDRLRKLSLHTIYLRNKSKLVLE
jgi:rRNA-processing protein FCF1